MTMNKAMLMNLTNEELIRSLDDKRRYSPVIDILLQRFEEILKEKPKGNDNRVECPICQSTLTVELDEGNSLYGLKPMENT